MTSSALFLTGASGFVGRSFLSKLPTSLAPQVMCLSRNLAASAERKASFVQGTLEASAKYLEALRGCDTVVHVAARVRRARPETVHKTNVEGTRVLLDACAAAGVRRFLYLSCASAAHPREAHDYVAQSKRDAEALVQASKLEWTILRPTLIMGYRSPMQRALTALATAKLTPMFCSGSALVQPIWSDDFADLMVEWVRGQLQPRTILEYGGPTALPLAELLTRIARTQLDRDLRKLPLPFGPTRGLLGFAGKLFLELAPAAAEDMNLFRHGSNAKSNPIWEARKQSMVTLDQMLTRFKDGPDPHPFSGH